MSSSKSTKKTSGGSPRSYSEVYKSSASAPAMQASAATAAQSGVKSAPVLNTSDSVDWWGEYGYVLNDLKYLGLVTAGLLVAIVIVGFFL